jgi:hypothetical protein
MWPTNCSRQQIVNIFYFEWKIDQSVGNGLAFINKITAFTAMPLPIEAPSCARLFPTLLMGPYSSLDANFGDIKEKPFKCKPEDCCPYFRFQGAQK